MPKERNFNPAQAHRKAEKQKEIAKSRKNLQAQRNEKLARRNPERLQKQIDELQTLDERGVLRPKDKETLTQLERDVRGIRRAREALGDAAPQFPSHTRTGEDRGKERGGPRDSAPRNPRHEQHERRQHLGKRQRDAENDAHDSDTDPEVRTIPMPRDTPPPLPAPSRQRFADPQMGPDGTRTPHALPSRPTPAAPAQTTYSSAPQLRDLKKEAVKFVPTAVATQKRRVKGDGRLLEPEEIEQLEKAGYYAAEKAAEEAGNESHHRRAVVNAAPSNDEKHLQEEMKRFEQEIEGIYSAGGKDPPRLPLVEDVEDTGD